MMRGLGKRLNVDKVRGSQKLADRENLQDSPRWKSCRPSLKTVESHTPKIKTSNAGSPRQSAGRGLPGALSTDLETGSVGLARTH